MIDTHCHLTFPDFAGRLGLVLERARGVGVTGVITVATTPGDASAALACATCDEAGGAVWCTSGLHPLYSDKLPTDAALRRDAWRVIAEVAQHERCVAFGELGLDNHYDEPPKNVQRAALDEHLALIADHPQKKPIVVHCRDAFDELIPIFERSGIDPRRFVFHCFTAGPREMELVMGFGACASFTGVLTYPNAPEVREAAAIADLSRVMMETDAPFLPPQPVRKRRPNEPAAVVHVLDALAAAQGVPLDEAHAAVNANTERFFGVPAASGPLSLDPLEDALPRR